MFTVKHINPNGSESLVAVDSVSFDREKNCLYGHGPSVVWTSGSAYVMNEQGKTVGVYNLDMTLGTRDVTGDQAEQARRAAKAAAK